ncbi:Uncharacterised protein [Acinetobacter baumannii]|uniref:Uncharacterized protein n=1 Tax=Acinetobacter phage AbTZA1 TaxID=2500827 RepID=A0A3T0IH83_9CAUD|nr:hypothetical protein HYP74_gp099 [Acinetobacter phage AbTZA1]AZU98770.1 hypothetical protein [Acinetobacter phage AbTZA1]SSU39457.1 Uncharacterised protein [Acinetobacter baumannii]
MSTNQFIALFLMFLYSIVRSLMPPMDFADPGYLFGLAIVSYITYVICFKLVK